ncbi:Mannose-6-phosphate isomerase 1 [Raphanus sativus]|uniref:mannose-6-phosphate isomerase n=1 Tax=Raphanus sativus TaxID=3726 RepID=A0A6J0P9G3_RAPSA|nr:mannose-6-phosphate isomerase 1 [Raphanus sativus]KAJ4892716.1 Mannose-6-phosphate isomerase 1 [Raphanus sativus]
MEIATVLKANGGCEADRRRLRRLRCSVKDYAWGKIGSDSLVYRVHAANSDREIDATRPYAELWMGTHESGPSYLEDGVTLRSWIAENPESLGDRVLEKWGCDLPFLFKVLSVGRALSIQSHPDKNLAKKLHKAHPNLYKDDNHKPEMALAYTQFEALCGFIPLQELKSVIRAVPEIEELVGSEEVNQVFCISEHDEEKVKSAVRTIFTLLMSAGPDTTKQIVSKLKHRLHMESQERHLTDKERLVLKLEKQYPDDIGVISAFFFNYVKLNPGEALYLGANEPHAYLFGECIEVMATSDNVVRAGLTPKPLDIQTLCSMLSYKLGFPEILKGSRIRPYITRYLPPFEEFEVDLCDLPCGASTVFPSVPGPSLLLVLQGEGRMSTDASADEISMGDVLFVPADTEIHLKSSSDLKLYRAGINSRFLDSP